MFESIYAATKDKSPDSLRDVRDRASAACLFRYKYCWIHEELFLMSWVRRWVKSSSAVNNAIGAIECRLDTLLIALETMESWTDEIASMKRDNPIAE
jgi:hypothetical protein